VAYGRFSLVAYGKELLAALPGVRRDLPRAAGHRERSERVSTTSASCE
jgi:hypothetical protein